MPLHAADDDGRDDGVAALDMLGCELPGVGVAPRGAAAQRPKAESGTLRPPAILATGVFRASARAARAAVGSARRRGPRGQSDRRGFMGARVAHKGARSRRRACGLAHGDARRAPRTGAGIGTGTGMRWHWHRARGMGTGTGSTGAGAAWRLHGLRAGLRLTRRAARVLSARARRDAGMMDLRTMTASSRSRPSCLAHAVRARLCDRRRAGGRRPQSARAGSEGVVRLRDRRRAGWRSPAASFERRRAPSARGGRRAAHQML
ncbi:hypothetical protein Dimus_037574 [Dionaea muscipula]